MRQDQLDRLEDIEERVAEVFMAEADPDGWNGAGVSLKDMDEKTRGGRYWDKKNAIQTGTLLARVQDLRKRDGNNLANPMPEEDAEQEVRRFEKEAKEAINRAARGGLSRTS